jgi:UDP-N-acetylglucosamine 2-epimerase (non-hydrolysing)
MISAMKILIVVGARPNFMKAAPILKAMGEFNAMRGEWAETLSPILVHTGQHYDAKMSDAFFADLDMPQPDVFLGAGSGTHAEQTAEVMKRFEPVLWSEKPDARLVVGDVNSTLACALVAAKLPMKSKPLIAHVEAGLRSGDRGMPEEINRILTDRISDLLFVSEDSGMRNLCAEGIPLQSTYFVGNTMIDSLREHEAKADASAVLREYQLGKGGYVLLTLHRPANVDDGESFIEILEALGELAESRRIIFPAHPRTQKQIHELGLEPYFDGSGACGIRMIDPQGYLDFLCLMKYARLVVTDSGGVQEETTALGVPCATLRDNTERPATIECGTNILGGTAGNTIQHAIRKQLVRPASSSIPELWDGRAASRIVGILAERRLQDSRLGAAPAETVELAVGSASVGGQI